MTIKIESLREAWIRDVRGLAQPPLLEHEEQEELRQILQSKAMKKACRLVYARIAQEALAMLGDQAATLPQVAGHLRSPDVTFGHLWEMCNE